MSITSQMLNINHHIIDGYVVQDNTPSADCITWSDLHMTYKGITYQIQDGYTNYKYIYWDYSVSKTQLVASNTLPILTDDDVMLFFNKSGVHMTVPKATVIDGGLIVTESIMAPAIAANAITTVKINAGAVTSNEIATGTITANNLSVGCVTANAIAANAIGATAIAANVITGDKLVADSITAREIASKTITANEIASNTITAAQMVAGTITADSGIISSIDASKITTGTLSADRISGGTLVGVNIQTASADNYVHLTDNLIELYQTWENGAGYYNGVTIPAFGVYTDMPNNTATLYLQAPDPTGSLRAGVVKQDANGLHLNSTNGTRVDNKLWVSGGTKTADQSACSQLIGDYDQKTTTNKMIWTIGDQWNTWATHYGLGYEFGNVTSNTPASEHMLTIRQNGVTNTKLGLNGNAGFAGTVAVGNGAGAVNYHPVLFMPSRGSTTATPHIVGNWGGTGFWGIGEVSNGATCTLGIGVANISSGKFIWQTSTDIDLYVYGQIHLAYGKGMYWGSTYISAGTNYFNFVLASGTGATTFQLDGVNGRLYKYLNGTWTAI